MGMNEAERERVRGVQRAVADRITDEMLTKPARELTDVEAAMLAAALRGQFADEIMARIDALNAARRGVSGDTR